MRHIASFVIRLIAFCFVTVEDSTSSLMIEMAVFDQPPGAEEERLQLSVAEALLVVLLFSLVCRGLELAWVLCSV